jgi:hypothetical protein
MNKVELKHLAPYLPYGLKVELLNFPIGKHIREFELDCGHDFGLYMQNNWVRPYLRPLSDLDNVTLRKAMYSIGHTSHIDWTTDERDYLIKKRGYNLWFNDIPYAIVNYLFKNLYDVFNLIDNGLAYDIKTLEDEDTRL